MLKKARIHNKKRGIRIMKKKKLVAMTLVAMMSVSGLAGCSNKDNANNKSSDKVVESTETKKEVKAQNIKAEDLTPLSDKGVISGVKDMTVAEGTKVNLNELVYVDKTLVKSVDVDDSKVDYSKAGTYEVVYTITFNGDKLRDYIKSNNLTVSFDTTGDTVVVKTTVTVTVATKEDADAAIANGDTSVVTEETKSAVQKENKAKANDNAVESKPAPTQSNSSKKNDNSSNSNSGNSSANSGSSGNNGNHNGNSGNNGNTNNNGNHNGNTNGNGNNNGSGNNGSTDKPQQHTHNYVEVSRTNATCTAAGSITKKCDCGKTITVPNGDALAHDPVTKTDKGHNVHTVIQAAWDEDVYESRYICNGCGATFTSNRDAGKHVAASGVNGTCHNYYATRVKVDTIHHPEQATDEWVVDPYKVCSRCGQQL